MKPEAALPLDPASRRRFVAGTLALAGAAALAPRPSWGAEGAAPRAIAFDAFTTFDPRPVNAVAEQQFPGQGMALINAWRTRQFEYTWLRTVMGRYVSFLQVTEEALVFAGHLLKLDMTPARRDALMQAFMDITAWPDALPALKRLRGMGVRLAFLANPSNELLDRWVRNAGLQGLYEAHLSTDRVRAFKPDPRAYQMGIDGFGVPKEAIVFAAFGGWDAAGARSFGYTTYWVNRGGTPVEELGVKPDGAGTTLTELAEFIAARS